MDKITLTDIFKIEPELEALAARALQHRRDDYLSRLRAYEVTKQAALGLVGTYARKPELQSTAAWDAFIGYVMEGLEI